MQMDNSQHFTANKETTHKKCTNRFHKFPSFSTSIHLRNWKYFAVKQAFLQYIIVPVSKNNLWTYTQSYWWAGPVKTR